MGLVRLELTTSRLSGVRSNLLSYKPTKDKSIRVTKTKRIKHGEYRVRTGDLLRAKQALSQLS